jgi:hypothetical protein
MARKKTVSKAEREFLDDLKSYITDVRLSVKALTRLVNMVPRDSGSRQSGGTEDKRRGKTRRATPRP